MIRKEVEDFVRLGPLPSEDTATDEQFVVAEAAIKRIQKPVTDEEAVSLIECFGPDDCYGGAWTLLHLIESAPSGAPVWTKPSATANEWIRRLWDRAERGRAQGIEKKRVS